MAQRKIDPKEQFSKKLAARVEWFWFGYMILCAAVMVLQPASALPAFYLACLSTGVMLASVYLYTKNSVSEKGFYWLAEIAKAAAGIKPNKDTDTADDDSEGGNG